MEQFTQILREATAAIPPEYFLLPIHGGDSVYRERVYCYEFYHQMRRLWPPDCPYRLNGEVDKRSHPYLQDGGQPKPDLLVHQPGTGENYAVIEVKSSRAAAREIDKDLGTLTLFMNRLGYHRAIYLIYGAEAPDAAVRVHECAARFQQIAPFELWLHSTVGTPAAS
ncbi:MAG: hypothetical protein ABSD75_24630 [Terriglobales bacterium]|jgi:hypothetical protein